MRTFQETHPWISFQLDLRRAPWTLWVRLGEAASKCVHLTKVPLRPTTAQQLNQLYLAKGAAATTAIEGNTLSEEQVLAHIRGELELPPSQEYLRREVDNILLTCNDVVASLSESTLPSLTPELISQYNSRVREGLEESPEISAPGVIRTESVLVGNVYRGAPAKDCDFLLERLCTWLNGGDFEPKAGYSLPWAILKATVAHLYLAWIHPFGDGNGRTARIVELHILLSAGVPQPAAHLLSNHYNQTRAEYYRRLDRASKAEDPLSFIEYAVEGFVDGLREQLGLVWDQQWDVAWQNHVHQLFKDKTSPAQTRLRHLALDLGEHRDWVFIPKIPDLSPRLAKAYAYKTPKTVRRDIEQLRELDLIESSGLREVRARREIIQGFLPVSRAPVS